MAERVVQTCCCCCAPTFHPYVVTCNIFDLRGPTSLSTCLLLTHIALCQRVRGVIARTRYINVLTYLLTSVVL